MVKIAAKKYCFEVPQGDGTTRDEKTFAGYLERVDMEFQPFDAAKNPDLPDRWSVKLIMSASPSKGRDPGDEITYQIPLSTHWKNSMFGNIINAIRGGLDSVEWKAKPRNRYVRIYLSEKAPTQPGARPTCKALVFKSAASSDWLDGQFPWDEENKTRSNVPQDLKEQTLFWLSVAKQCVDLTEGVVAGADKATIKFEGLHAVKPAALETAKPAGGVQVSEYETKVMNRLNLILADPIDDMAEKSLKMKQFYDELIEKYNPSKYGHTEAWLKGQVIQFATLNKVQDPFAPVDATGTPPTSTDDLPF